jgi:tetratricopeptide (TPR) repeat protein
VIQPAEAALAGPGQAPTVGNEPLPATPPVTEPPIVPAAAERQPPPVAEIPDGKAAATNPLPADVRPAEQGRAAAQKADPNTIARAIQRAEAARSSGDLALALTLYREVLRLQPDNASAAQAVFRIRMDYLLRRARSLLQAEDYDAALRDLDSVAAEDPDNKDADALRQEIVAAKSGAPRKPKG